MKKLSSIILILWILFGIVGFGTFIVLAGQPNIHKIKNDIINILNRKKNDDLMNVLPDLFDVNPSLSAIFIVPENDPDNIYASLYEKNRIQYKDYISLVNQFQENLSQFQKNGQYRIFLFNIKDKKIYLFFQKKWNHLSGLFLNPSAYPYFTLFFVLYVLIFFLLVLWMIYDMGEKKEKFSKSLHPQKEILSKKKSNSFALNSNTNNNHNHRKIISEKKNKVVSLKSSSEMVENRLKNLFEKIEGLFITEVIIYYSNENDKWKSILEKRDHLFIKGESVKNLPVSFARQLKDPLIKTETREIYFPVIRKSYLDGLIYIRYRESFQFNVSDLETLGNLVQDYSESLFIHKTYEKAIFHSESGFFTYPFLFFLLQEKTNHSSSFDLLFFQLPEADDTEKNINFWEDLRKYTYKFLSLSYADPKKLPIKIFFTDNQSMYVLIDYEKYTNINSILNKEDAQRICSEIQDLLKKHYSIFIPGALTSSSSDDTDANGILKRSKLEWELAKEKKIFGSIEKESIKPAYETSA